MFGFALDLVNAVYVKGAAFPHRGGGLGRDDSQTGLRVTGVRLNLEPDLKLAVL